MVGVSQGDELVDAGGGAEDWLVRGLRNLIGPAACGLLSFWIEVHLAPAPLLAMAATPLT